jgi:hypothetical protein
MGEATALPTDQASGFGAWSRSLNAMLTWIGFIDHALMATSSSNGLSSLRWKGSGSRVVQPGSKQDRRPAHLLLQLKSDGGQLSELPRRGALPLSHPARGRCLEFDGLAYFMTLQSAMDQSVHLDQW